MGENISGSRILITGGLGFIGSNITQKLISLNAKVTIFDACLDPYGWNFANINEVKEKVEFIKGDIRNMEAMESVVRDKDIIIDCASQISHTISIKNPLLDIDINCKGALTVLEAVRRRNDSAKLVYAGTRGQIGSMVYNPVDENHPTNPMDMNGINKLAAEKYHMTYNRIYGIKTTSLRINNTYGPRSQMKHGDYGIVNWFIKKAMLNEQITINGPGFQTRDYAYVEDIADAMILAAQNNQANGQIFMLGSGEEIKFIDVCNMILKATGSSMKIQHRPWPEERKKIEIGNYRVDASKAKEILGWTPKISMEEGLKRTVEFYKNRKEEYF